MASHASALKAHRQSLRRREINRSNRSRLRSAIKDLREMVASGEGTAAQKALPKTLSLVAKSVQRKILHANAAARHKSRLTKLVRGATAQASSKS